MVDAPPPDISKKADRARALFAAFVPLERTVYGNYTVAVAEDTTYYDGTFVKGKRIVPDEWQKQGIEAIVPPTGYNAVENAADHILLTPKFGVPPRPAPGDQREHAKTAEDKRRWTRAFWDHLSIEQGDPLAQAVKRIVGPAGKVVIKKEIRWDLVDDRPVEPFGLDRFMWKFSVPPPETIFEDPDNPTDPSYVYEKREIRVRTARKLFPKTVSLMTKQEDAKVTMIEYWSKPEGADPGLFIIWIAGELVVMEDNPYRWETARSTPDDVDWDGYQPYHIRPSGWGERTLDGDPEKLYVGMLRRMHSVLDAEARHITAASAQMLIATFPMIEAFGLDEGKKAEVGLGKLIRFDDKEKQGINIVKWPEVPRTVFDILNRVSDFANDLSKFGTLGGGPVSGIDTATEADQANRNAASKLQKPVNAIRSLIVAITRQVWQDIDRVLEWPVALAGSNGDALLMLTPEQLNGFYMVTAELTTTDRAALDRMLTRLWIDAYNSLPGLSMEDAMTNAGMEEPWESMKKRAAEDTFFSPEQRLVRTQLSLAALGAAGEAVRQASAATTETQLGGAQGPQSGGGAPNGATRPPAPSGNIDAVVRDAQADAQTNQTGRENA